MIVLNYMLYYLVLIPLSVLPFFLLHAISSCFYVVLYYVVGYRKKVVLENIRNSFPEKTAAEHKEICKRFYKHLCDVMIEGFTIFTISKKRLQKHITCVNPELVNNYHAQNKSVIIAVGHYNSWELLLTSFDLFIEHTAVIIYQPLSNSFLDKKMCEARSKHGTNMLPAKNVKAFFRSSVNEMTATVFAIDQSPPDPTRSYWMEFLNQDTPVLFGTEKYAKEYNQPVVYARLNKLKRGYYQLEFVEVEKDPASTTYGEITQKVTGMLEKDIIAHPEFWLWSHKRWKHKRKK